MAVYNKSHLVLIDWKTSEKKKRKLESTFDNPLQIAAYVGALNQDQRYGVAQVNQGMIVLAYNDGSPADVLRIEPKAMQRYWREWLVRLSLYKKMRESSVN